MNRIEKNKKVLGISLISIISLIYIAVYLIFPSSIYKILLSFLCVVSLYISTCLFKDGIIGVIKSLVNIITFTILTITVGKLSEANDLPFIQTFIATSIIFSALYFYARIPNRVVYFFKKYIFKIKEKENKKDAMDYNKYRIAQNFKSQINKRNSIFNVDLKGKINRILFVLIASFCSLYFIMNGEIIYSLVWIIFGISTLFYGILTGIKFVCLLTVYVAICITLKGYLEITPNNKLEYYSTIVGLYIIVLALFTKLFVRMYKKMTEYVNIVNFRIGDKFNSCDVFLDLVCPIAEYDNLITYNLNLKLEENEITFKDARKINLFIKELYEESTKEEYIIAGTSIDKETKIANIYIYSKKEDKEIIDQSVTKKALVYGYEIQSIKTKKDSKWKFYKENIFPDKYIAQEIINRNYISFLSRLNIKEDEEQKVLYCFYFKTLENAKKFVDEMKKNYYNLESLDELKQIKEKLNLKNEDKYGVIISNKSKIGIQRMNMQTRNLINIAEKNEGKFDGWTIDKINKEKVNLY